MPGSITPMEELPVELFAREIVNAEGLSKYHSEKYNFRILQLRWLNKTYSIAPTDMIFAQRLFAQPVVDRKTWLDNKILSGSAGVVEYNKGREVLESILRWN